jgi:hypothetical protein
MSSHHRDDGATPLPPLKFPPPRKAPVKPKPKICYVCRANPAKQLPNVEAECALPIFCSMLCAVNFGIKRFLQSRIGWCLKHEAWTTPDGACQFCRREKVLSEADQPLSSDKQGGKK